MNKEKNGSSLCYHLTEGLHAVWRNRLVNTGAVGLLVTCLLFTGIFALLMYNLNQMVEALGARNQIRVFVAETADDAAVSAVGAAISDLEGVSQVSFVSKAEALESLRAEYGSLLDGLENDNPLRDGFTVTIGDQAEMEAIAAQIRTIPNVAKLSYEGEAAAKIVEIRSLLFWGGLLLCGVFGVTSIIIVANAVRVSLFTRHREIKIMKIIGATNGFVRAPFVFEGQVLGIVGAGLAYLLVWLFYDRIFVPAVDRLGFVSAVPFSTLELYMAASFLTAGIAMGMFGSMVAINRYLKQ